MYLKQIEVENFKSFGKKLTIPMLSGFTAVTGPNGSGKSNIADAILFVLGPKSSKAIRAGKLSDLIFNGGNAKAPANHTRVSLVFDNADRTIPLDEDIVKLTRYVKLSDAGEGYNSYFYVNERKSTLTEFDFLLSSARISAEGYNLVQQGDVTHIVEMSTIDRRRVLDEISGIAKFDEEILKAEVEKCSAQDNIDRIAIILGELDKQIRQLEQERGAALKYLEMRDRLSLAKARLAHKRKEGAEAEIRGISEQIASYSKEIEAHKTRKAELESQIRSIEDLYLKKENELQAKGGAEFQQLKEKMDGLRVDVARASDLRERSTEQMGEVRDEIKALSEERDALLKEKQGQEASLVATSAELKSLDEKVKKLQRDEAKLKGELSSYDSELSALEKIIKEKDQHIRERSEALHVKKLEKERLERLAQDLGAELEALHAEQESADFEVKDLDWRVKEIGKQGKDSSGSLKSMQEQFYSKKNRETQLTKMAAELEQAVRNLTREYNHLKAEEEAAVNVARGYNRAVKAILEARDRSEMKGIHGTIAELADVDPKYEVALNVAAGGRMQSIIVEDDEVASNAINYLKRSDLGRATFLPLNKMLDGKPRGKALLAEKEAAGFAIDLIKFDEQYRAAFWYVFGDTVVVDTLQKARQLMGGVRLVTAGGELIEASGAMVGGTVEGSKLKFGSGKGKADEVAEELRKATEQADKVSTELTTLRQEVIDLESKIREISGSDRGKGIELEGLKKQLAEQKVRSKRVTEGAAAKQTEKERALSQTAELGLQITKMEGELTKLRAELEVSTKRQMEIAPTELSQKLREAQSTLTSISQSLSEKRTEHEFLKLNAEVRERRLNEMAGQEEQFKEKLRLLDAQGKGAGEKENRSKVELAALKKIEDSMGKEITALRDEKEKLLRQKGQALADREKVAVKLETSNDFLIGLNTKKTLGEEKLRELVQEIAQHNLAVSYPLPSLDDIHSEMVLCENSLNGMGAVNLRSIEDYDEKKARHVELRGETKRLEDQRDQLVALTDQLNEKKKVNLVQVYDAVNANFRRVYAELSGGGEAELLLENPQEPFQGGLVIKARPRNGKVLRLEALSGGEKSLTALAFIFALQEWQPSPFYLLDEVDMFLDAVNAEMVANRVKKSSTTAQFVQISLRKVTLNKADHIIGVTKPAGGISNIIFKPNIGDLSELEKDIELPEDKVKRDG
ncbi:MAG: chromosome segregation protein SMC [Methanomassiliicoccales archaeon]|nr:chromosome segregation protein SMC [Methanomassiliicoccales archaeon]